MLTGPSLICTVPATHAGTAIPVAAATAMFQEQSQ